MIPYAIMIGEKHTYFLYHHYKFIEDDKVLEGTLLNASRSSLDPYDYYIGRCGVDSFKKLDHSLIHTLWPDHGEDQDQNENIEDEILIEPSYTNGNNDVVKIFNQNCVICFERDSVYAFRQCGHQCICEQCYENKGDIDILTCIVCRT